MRSIRYRLALLFFAVLLTAVGFVYLYVVPQLETSLRGQKLEALARTAQASAGRLAATLRPSAAQATARAVVDEVADRTSVRVTLLNVQAVNLGRRLRPTYDSAADPQADELQFPVAEEAARSGRPASGTEASAQGRLGQAAVPLRVNGQIERVAVLSTPLSDVQATVALVRRQVLVGGAIALALGVLGGYGVARALARRVKRLELAAERVAAGDFSGRVQVEGNDELTQLAAAFATMQGQLAQLDSARKRFIAVASHELRTPIFSLSGFAELLRDEDLDEETRREFLAQMVEQIERLRKLSLELLDLSKLDAGSLVLHAEPVDVGDLARTVAAEFTPALQRHDSALELRLAGDRLEATCDPDRVAQVMRILVDNALAHTPPGTPIVVGAAREDGHLRVAVRDFGTGIPRADLARIWEPFYTSNGASGSGLGLPIARELADRMNGRLEVDSAPGRTTFTLELPA